MGTLSALRQLDSIYGNSYNKTEVNRIFKGIYNMENEEEWKEIEKSLNKADTERFKAYKGLDITEMLKETKPRNKVTKKIIKRISKPVVAIFTIIILFIIITVVGAHLTIMKNSHNIDVKQQIESFKHIKVNQISADLDKKGYNRRVSL